MADYNGIGTLGEKSLHASLKGHFFQPGDQVEVEVEGYYIDIVRGNLLIEIQTKNFSAMKKKLTKLSQQHSILLIHPIAEEKWIVKQEEDGEIVSRRKSPKRGRVEDMFRELLRIPEVVAKGNIRLWIALVSTEVTWVNDGQGSWRRKKWSIGDEVLLKVNEVIEFNTLSDYSRLIPRTLPNEFTNKELSKALGIQNTLAIKMSYTLRKMGILEVVRTEGKTNFHARVKI